jgi:hypothetical protein
VAQRITNSQILSLVCPKWTGPDQARTSLPGCWTGPIPVQKLLGLDSDWTGLDQSGLVHTRTTGIIAYVWTLLQHTTRSLIITQSVSNGYSRLLLYLRHKFLDKRHLISIIEFKEFAGIRQIHYRMKGNHCIWLISRGECGVYTVLHNQVTIGKLAATRKGSVLMVREAAQTRKHLFCNCKRWKNEQWQLLKEAGQATGRETGRCRYAHTSEL